MLARNRPSGEPNSPKIPSMTRPLVIASRQCRQIRRPRARLRPSAPVERLVITGMLTLRSDGRPHPAAPWHAEERIEPPAAPRVTGPYGRSATVKKIGSEPHRIRIPALSALDLLGPSFDNRLAPRPHHSTPLVRCAAPTSASEAMATGARSRAGSSDPRSKATRP